MKRNRLVSLALSLTMLLTLALPVRAEETPFPDTEGHWAQNVLDKWHSFGVIAGDTWTGAFRPDDSLSRAEFATLLNRIMGYPMVEIKHFKDVPADAWYAETMSRLNSAGIIQGDGNNMVRPQDPVTRQETAVILCRALGIEEQKAGTSFLDANEISSWAEGAVGALYNMGAVQGWEGYFNPQDPITRSQAVILLNNLIGGVMTHPGTWTQDVRGDFYVNTKRVRLENMTVTGDLILTAGIDTGDVTLSGVTVKGDILVRGGGEKSIHIQSGCHLEGEMILTKTIDGTLRVVNESDTPLPAVHVDAGKSTVILEGNLSSVAVNCSVPILLRNGKTESLSVTAPNSNVTVEKGHTAAALTVEKDAKDSEITVAGTVTALTSNAAVTVNNSGKIDSAHAAAGGLTLAGTLPTKVTMASGVSRPRDGSGKPISASTLSSSGQSYSSSSSGGGSSSGGSPSSSGSSPSGSDSSSNNSNSGSNSGSNNNNSGNNSGPGSGTGGPSGSVGINSQNPSEIISVGLTLTAPAFGEVPASVPSLGELFTLSTQWRDKDGSAPTYRFKPNSDSPDTFTADHVYQAVITLTPSDGHHFAETVTVTLNGDSVTPVPSENGALTVTQTFPRTDKKDFVEDTTISLGSQDLTEGDQVTATMNFSKDNQLADPATYHYQWWLDHTIIDGATQKTYTFQVSAGEHSLSCDIGCDLMTISIADVTFTVKQTEATENPDLGNPDTPENPNPDHSETEES